MKNHENDVLQLATRAGRIMLENGGEVYRVEDTVQRICKGYGAVETDCYATPTAIIASVVGTENETHSRVHRITSRSVNISKIEGINDFSRSLNGELPSIDDAHEMLNKIERREGYTKLTRVLASGIGTGTFSVLFGGDIVTFLFGFVIGALVRAVLLAAMNRERKDISIHVFSGALCVFLSWLAYITPLAPDWRLLSLSALMFMTPGVMFINALRDTASGELIAGISSIVETLMIAGALAFGSILVYVPISYFGGGTF